MTVANVPKGISSQPKMSAPVKKPTVLVTRHPRDTPTIITGSKTGRRVRASATRICTVPKEIGASARLTAEYMAAIIAAKAIW